MNQLITIDYTPKKTTSISPHTHTKWEFVCYLSGTGVLTVGNRKYPFKPGDIICQPPGIPHSEVSKDGFQNIFLIVDSYERDALNVHRFEDNPQKDVYKILSMIYRVFHLKKHNWQATVQSLLDVFNHFISASIQTPSKNNYVHQLEELLIENIGNSHYNLRSSMDNFPICNDHLRRLFKSETGLSPRDYLKQKRMAYAKTLISNSTSSMHTIKYIAAMVGYQDPYYFSNVFKKTYGLSPLHYSKQ